MSYPFLFPCLFFAGRMFVICWSKPVNTFNLMKSILSTKFANWFTICWTDSRWKTKLEMIYSLFLTEWRSVVLLSLLVVITHRNSYCCGISHINITTPWCIVELTKPKTLTAFVFSPLELHVLYFVYFQKNHASTYARRISFDTDKCFPIISKIIVLKIYFYNCRLLSMRRVLNTFFHISSLH